MKKFLEEKKRELKFKLAGPGHKLSESTSAGPSGSNSSSASLNAALQRCSKQPSEKNRKPNQLEGGDNSLKGKSEEEMACTINNQRVLFKCDEIEDGLFPMDTWKEKFRSHVQDLKSSDPIKSSVMMIRLLNSNEDAEHCIKILEKIIQNLITYPDEEKYKLIRLGNVNIRKILKVEGAIDFLHVVGFEDQMIIDKDQKNEESYLVHQKKEDIDLAFALHTLNSSRGYTLTLDRSFKIIKQRDDSSGEEQPDEFFEWTITDLKKEHRTRREEFEKNSQFRTRKMRDEDIKPRVLVKYVLIRVKVTSDLTIQGTFSSNEKLKDLRKFLDEKIEFKDKFIFLSLPAKTYSEIEEEKSFIELGLFPAVVLVLKFIGDSKNDPKAILKPINE